ncbi:MAG: flagellar biosynthetic protein FliO [Micropepsaceae bacterium]
METTNYLQFGAALIFVLALIGAIALLLRAFGGLNLTQRRPGDRRLSIIESLLVDARRRIILVRRDDEEYLVLLSPHGDIILDDRIKVKDIPESPISGSTFVTIKTEPRL